MITEFNKIMLFGSYISKEHSKDLFRLLHLYKDISASEAASRLGLHIRTAQDFFEAMFEAGILNKNEVFESKRPYFRYTLKADKIRIELDLHELSFNAEGHSKSLLRIREKKNANVRFTTSRNKLYFSNVTIWIGKGRDTSEKKVSLTAAQGKFLFNLPFPDAEFMTVTEIIKKANVEKDNEHEIMDIVNLLIENKVIEVYN